MIYQHKLNKREREQLSHIESIKIGHLNSAGVSSLVAKECQEDLEFLLKHSPDNDKISVSLNDLRFQNDKIQETGQSNIMHNIDPQYAKVEVLHVTMEEKWYSSTNLLRFLANMLLNSRLLLSSTIRAASSAMEVLNAHSSFHFVDKNDHQMHYYSNDSENGRQIVSKHLTDKSELEHTKIGSFFKSALKTAFKMRS